MSGAYEINNLLFNDKNNKKFPRSIKTPILGNLCTTNFIYNFSNEMFVKMGKSRFVYKMA